MCGRKGARGPGNRLKAIIGKTSCHAQFGEVGRQQGCPGIAAEIGLFRVGDHRYASIIGCRDDLLHQADGQPPLGIIRQNDPIYGGKLAFDVVQQPLLHGIWY